MLKPGELIPDVSLESHDGRTLQLRVREGRKLLLWYYPKADTPG